MSANQRIQWLHKKISDKCYPNAHHLAQRFKISPRQAQRDVEFLRNNMGAPVVYSAAKRGYYYSEPFVFSPVISNENDVDINDAIAGIKELENFDTKPSAVQLQVPYQATLEIKDRMAVLNLRRLIVSDEPHHRYRCEFPSVELFMGIIISTGADVKIIEPRWLKEKLVNFATRVIENNPLDEDEDEN